MTEMKLLEQLKSDHFAQMVREPQKAKRYLLETYTEDTTVEMSGDTTSKVCMKPLCIWDEENCRAAIVMPLKG
jgi:hypothetical protein